MTSVKTEGLEEYNPFTDGFRQSQPAVVNTGDIGSTEKYKSNEGTSLISTNDNIRSYRQSRKNSENNSNVENNWPFFPDCCPFQPCFYLNIPGDIPDRMMDLVTAAYYIWIAYSITMIFNVFGALAYFLSTGSMEAGSTFGMSVVLVLLLPVLTFIGWFRPLYKAAKFDSSVSYFIYFLTSFGQVIITTIQSVGINWLGACGWLNGTIVVIKYKTAGTLMLVIATLFTILLVSQVALLIQVHRKYRNIDQPSSDSKGEESIAIKLKRTDSLREIASASMKNGTNFILGDMRDDK